MNKEKLTEMLEYLKLRGFSLAETTPEVALYRFVTEMYGNEYVTVFEPVIGRENLKWRIAAYREQAEGDKVFMVRVDNNLGLPEYLQATRTLNPDGLADIAGIWREIHGGFLPGEYVFYFPRDGATVPAKVLSFTKHRVRIEADFNQGTRTATVSPDNLCLQSEYP